MRHLRYIFVLTLGTWLLVLTLAACGGESDATPTTPASAPGGTPTANATIGAPANAETGYCPNGGAVVVQVGDPLAAKVNGQPIPLSLYNQQASQSQVALVQQGVDPNSDQGKQAIRELRAQVLDQLIDDAMVEQAAAADNINVNPAEINNRVEQVINDAGSMEKFQEYLTKNQLTIQDLCQQIRANLFGEAMMARVTANMPTSADQIHVAHMLFANKADADAALVKLRAGADFAALAKQVSQDEATRDNGGDLGWFPRNVMPPEFEQAAFALKPGEISGVVSTQLGLHIVKLLERAENRPLTPELIQNQRLTAFSRWLEELRAKATIEKLVQE